MTRRSELTDDQSRLIADLMPSTRRPGGRWNDHRTTLDGIFWILHPGAQWRELPERSGQWKTVYDRFNRFRGDGTIGRIPERLLLKLGEDGRIDEDLWCIDATSIRASRSAAGAGGGGKRWSSSRLITPWAAPRAASAPSSTWSSMAMASRWRRG